MSEPNTQSLPTIAEHQASGTVAQCYADIRATLGVGVVNLIWRHVASIPGGLAWAWPLVRPLYGLPRTAAAAAAVAALPGRPHIESFSTDERRAAGLDDAAVVDIRRVLATYERGNGLNLIVLSALALHARGERPPVTAAPPPGQPARADGPIPPIPALHELDGSVAALVQQANRLGAHDGGAIIASLYRHLAFWPGLLRLAVARLQPLHDSGRLQQARQAARDAAAAQAAALLGALGEDTPVPADTRRQVVEAIEQFRSMMIPRMVVIGAVLSDALR